MAKRLTQLRRDAADKGFAVFRHSPGDGVSRYAFFKRPVKKDQGYFGPDNPDCVTLGLKKAQKFLVTGTCPVTRSRGGLKGPSKKRSAKPRAAAASSSDVRSPTRTEVRSPTRTEVRSPTRTATSTEAYTQGNVTVTGGAGAGATTTVTIAGRGRGGKKGISVARRGKKK